MKSRENWTYLEIEGSLSYPSSRYRGSTLQIKVKKKKKNSEINHANIFCWKIYAEESVIFQKIFSSMADFRDIVSVMPCSATDKSK